MIETTVDKPNDLTIHKCSGVLTEQKLLDKIQTFYDSNPTLYTLWDFSHAATNSISQEAVRKMLALVQRVGPRRRGGKTAVVAPKDLEYGMARMFQLMSDDTDFPFEIKVFRYFGEASQWLFEKE
jgi:hypothetical protein